MLARLIPLLIVFGCGKPVTETQVVRIPQVTTVQTPVKLPGTTTVVNVPQTVILDPGFEISTLPLPIQSASPSLQYFSAAVAKVFTVDGASGTGFFVSADGLFLTNDHVIPSNTCKASGCPGVKIIRDFRIGGVAEIFTAFEVLAHSSQHTGLDFTLLRVKLPAGKKVPYLKLALEPFKYDFGVADNREYKVLGHPGGGGLRFTNVKPVSQTEYNIELLGLLIGGNSGGPLINELSGEVVAQVKATRTSFLRAGPETAQHQTRGRGTSMRDILRTIGQNSNLAQVMIELNPSGVRLGPLDPAEAWPLTTPPVDFPGPTARTFQGALRASGADMRGHSAMTELNKYLNTPQEAAVLELMFGVDPFTASAPLNLDLLQALFKKQVKLGRALRISQSAQLEVDTLGDSYLTYILANYFDEVKREAALAQCRQAVSQLIAQVYVCGTNKDQQGQSLLAPSIEFIKQQNYATVDDFGLPMGFVMFLNIPGITSDTDRAQLIELGQFLNEKNEDVEVLMQTDAMLAELVLGTAGPGSFSSAF